MRKARPYKPGARECDLCLTECYAILKEKGDLTNRGNEIIIKCLHKFNQTFEYWGKTHHN